MTVRWKWTIEHFRNLQIDIELEDTLTIIVGPNASGKTSLLEAFYWMAHGRSFRTRRKERVIRSGAAAARVRIEWPERLETVELVLPRDGPARLYVQGHPVAFSTWREQHPILYLGGRAVTLLATRASYRRQFLDGSLSTIFPQYRKWLQRFLHARTQRNAVLAAGYTNARQHAWDVPYSTAAAKIWEMRAYLVRQIRPIVERLWMRLFPGRSIRIALVSPFWSPEQSPPSPEEVLQLLEKFASQERDHGRSLGGPHRDDLHVFGPHGSFWDTASAGQIRALITIWGCAVARLVEQIHATVLRLLIDDFDAELDTTRARDLFTIFPHPYVLLTSHRKFWLQHAAPHIQRLVLRSGRLSTASVR